MKSLLLSLSLFIMASTALAQGVAISTDNSTADASAMLEVKSTTQGVLVPRMTTAQRNAISSPATGLLVFDSNAGQFYYYTGTAWGAVGTSQLEKITENGNTGWRLLGKNSNNYGDIGTNAVDLSQSGFASTSIGATGLNAFAAGINSTASATNAISLGVSSTASGTSSFVAGMNNTASADNAIAIGTQNTASQNYASAIGYGNESSGYFAISLGKGVVARAYGEVATGSHNTEAKSYNSLNFSSTDRAFSVGIGASASAKNDGLVVYKDGTIEIDSLTTSPSSKTNRIYSVNNEFYYSGNRLSLWKESGNNQYAATTGNIGIGTSSPNYLIDAQASGITTLNVQSSANTAIIQSVSPNATDASFFMKTLSGGSPSSRWSLGKSNGSEATNNSGSDFILNRYTNNGAYNGQPILIMRETGAIIFGNENVSTSANTVKINGSLATACLTIVTNNNTTILDGTHHTILYGGNITGNTISLPKLSSNTGRIYNIVNHSSSNILINNADSYIISNNVISTSFAAGTSTQIIFDGTNWHKIN